MKNYRVQIMWNPDRKGQHQRSVLVKNVENDVKALILAQAYFGPDIGYDEVSITTTTPGMEKRITEVI